MPRIQIKGGIYLDTRPGADLAQGSPYRFFAGPFPSLMNGLDWYAPIKPHTINVDLPDPEPLPLPEVTESSFGAFEAAL